MKRPWEWDEDDLGALILLCQTEILASDHVGKYNVMC